MLQIIRIYCNLFRRGANFNLGRTRELLATDKTPPTVGVLSYQLPRAHFRIFRNTSRILEKSEEQVRNLDARIEMFLLRMNGHSVASNPELTSGQTRPQSGYTTPRSVKRSDRESGGRRQCFASSVLFRPQSYAPAGSHIISRSFAVASRNGQAVVVVAATSRESRVRKADGHMPVNICSVVVELCPIVLVDLPCNSSRTYVERDRGSTDRAPPDDRHRLLMTPSF